MTQKKKTEQEAKSKIIKDKIYCYTGTGNNLASAKQLAAALDLEIAFITNELAEAKPVINGKIAIIMHPTYGYGIPKTVSRFILAATWNVEYMAVLTCIGSHHGGSLAQTIRLLKKRGQQVSYSRGIRSVENYVHMFGWPSEEKIEKRLNGQKEQTTAVIEDIKARKIKKRITFRPGSAFIGFITSLAGNLFAKRYKFQSSCTGCGICSKVCPANAIEMTADIANDNSASSQKPKPKVNPKKCDHCQACMQLCPQKAIKFGRIKPNGRRYCHTDIQLRELIKR